MAVCPCLVSLGLRILSPADNLSYDQITRETRIVSMHKLSVYSVNDRPKVKNFF